MQSSYSTKRISQVSIKNPQSALLQGKSKYHSPPISEKSSPQKVEYDYKTGTKTPLYEHVRAKKPSPVPVDTYISDTVDELERLKIKCQEKEQELIYLRRYVTKLESDKTKVERAMKDQSELLESLLIQKPQLKQTYPIGGRVFDSKINADSSVEECKYYIQTYGFRAFRT